MRFPDLDLHMLMNNMELLTIKQVTKSPRSVISWMPPPAGTWKFNVDGSSLGKPGPAGVGGVIRDSQGMIKLVFSKNIGMADSNLAELLAITEALSIIAKSSSTPPSS